MRSLPNTELSYGDPCGLASLREALAGYLGRVRGVSCEPDHVVVCNGFSHGLSLVARALADRGCARIAVEDPCHPSWREQIEWAGARCHPIEADDQGLRVDELAAVLVAGGLLVARERAPAQPAPIAAAVANYHAGVTAWNPTTEPPPARRLGDLTWRSSGQGELAGLPVVAHTYQDAAGRWVVLLRAARPFPQAHGARHQPQGAGADTTWVAEVDGVALFCADQAVVRTAPQLLALR